MFEITITQKKKQPADAEKLISNTFAPHHRSMRTTRGPHSLCDAAVGFPFRRIAGTPCHCLFPSTTLLVSTPHHQDGTRFSREGCHYRDRPWKTKWSRPWGYSNPCANVVKRFAQLLSTAPTMPARVVLTRANSFLTHLRRLWNDVCGVMQPRTYISSCIFVCLSQFLKMAVW